MKTKEPRGPRLRLEGVFCGRSVWPQVGVATGRRGHRSGQVVKVSLTGAVGLGESSSTHWPY